MSGQRPHHLTDFLGAAVESDISTSERLTDTITRCVPWQFPGRLLQTLASLGPGRCDETRLRHAVVALEYGCFHQYLHAIPQTDSRLVEPVTDSAYAENPTAAILDGDSLQACAFSRLTEATDDPAVIEQFYDLFAGASISCYEETVCSEPDTLELAHMAGLASRIAAEISRVESPNTNSIVEAGRTLGEAVPTLTPKGWQFRRDVDTAAARRQLAKAFTDSHDANQRIAAVCQHERELPSQDL